MRQLHWVVILGVATLVLSASTFYLSSALKRERTQTDLAAVSAAATAARQMAPSPPANASLGTAPVSSGAPLQSPTSPALGSVQKELPPEIPDDPAKRAARVAEFRSTIVLFMEEGLAYAGATARESELVLDAMAEGMLHSQIEMRRCLTTPGCDASAAQSALRESQREDIAGIIGAYKLRRMDIHTELLRIKSFINQPTANLPGNAPARVPARQKLSDTMANDLATALADERYRRVDRRESAADFNKRMYERAARILPADQLAAFAQAQDALFGRD